MSYCTKRRRVNINVAQNFACVLSEGTDENEATQTEQEINVNHHVSRSPMSSVNPFNELTPQSKRTNQSGDDVIVEDQVSEEIFPNFSDRDISSESDNETMPSEAVSITEQVANWASEDSIPLVSVSRLLSILQPHLPQLPADARTLLKTQTNVVLKSVAGGEYYHFGISAGIVSCLESHPSDVDTLSHHVKLQLNIDGLPLFKSSNTQLWPILGMVEGLSCRQPFVIGLYSGATKPNNLADFLNEFVSEMATLERDGLYFLDLHYNVSISAVICDAPARAYVKNVKGHSGYSGCKKCVQHGVYCNKITFPEVDAELRTDVQFDELADEDHHIGISPLARLSIGMASQFPLDYMHLVCLGVTWRLLLLWMSGPLRVRIGSRVVTQISSSLHDLVQCVPREIARKPRSLAEIKRWKATELRQFLLYTGPVVLCGKLSTNVYKNFVLFFTGIFILISPTRCTEYTEFAHQVLVSFVQNFSQIYGEDMLVYNVHGLVHLAEDSKRYGPLDNISAFPFENYLHFLKKLVRKPQQVVQQVVKRLGESRHKCNCNHKQTKQLGNVHLTGPLPQDMLATDCVQYKFTHVTNFYVSISQGNNCVGIGSDIMMVRNVISE